MKKNIFCILSFIFCFNIIAQEVDSTFVSDTIKVIPPADVHPEYPGGLRALRKEVKKKMKKSKKYLRKSSGGTIQLKFVVLEDGNIGDVTVIRGLNDCSECNQQAVTAIKTLKHKFSPGIQDGEPVKVWYSFPIRIVN